MNDERLHNPVYIQQAQPDTTIDDIKQGTVPVTGKYYNISPVINGQNIMVDLQGKHNIILDLGNINTISGDVTINLDAVIDGCDIGDQVIIMWKNPGTWGSVVFNISNKFYFLRSGLDGNGANLVYERMVLPFMFDGEKFCNTFSNG